MAEDKELQLSAQTQTGSRWEEKYILKRIDEEDIEISLTQRNDILSKINSGARFIQVDKYTLMINSIKSIDPKWGAKNIPPRPKEQFELMPDGDGGKVAVLQNVKELEEWDKLFSKKFLT